MPPIIPWNPNTPADSDPAAEGDDRIREIKQALDERLGVDVGSGTAPIIKNWPDGDLKLNSERMDPPISGALTVDTEANIPNPATTAFFYASDSKKLFVKNGAAYELYIGAGAATISSGVEADKPNPATTDFYVATDTNKLFAKNGAAYFEVTGGGGSSGAKTGKQLLIPATAFYTEHDPSSITINGEQWNMDDTQTTFPLFAPVLLPPGVTITKMELLGVVPAGNTSITANLYSTSFSTAPGQTVLATVTLLTTGSNRGLVPSGALNILIDGDTLYWLAVARDDNTVTDSVLIGVRITYDTPSAVNTL